jgi:hypothetical protein
MNQGAAGHAKALCREARRFSGLFQGSATVVPFIPPPIFGTNDTSLIMAISDVKKLAGFRSIRELHGLQLCPPCTDPCINLGKKL